MHPIIHNKEKNRFEFSIDGKLSFMQYHPINKGIEIRHTEVDKSLEGNGIGNALANQAVSYARNNQLRILPSCPFMKVFLMRHPEYSDLVM